tara:strand:- start:3307 stop:3675 length:369 start_codon:yes stop_codon:yes gene_type:complete
MATATKTKKSATKSAKKSKKSAKKATGGDSGISRSRDTKWTDKKVSVFKALKALKAFDSGSAKSAKVISKKAGLETKDVRHYCYHAQASGLVKVVDVEDSRGYSFHLTKAGKEIDPVKAAKA